MSKSIWFESAELPNFPSLEADAATDTVIVGGGIAGLLCAYYLHRRGVPYMLLEKGRICGGTTGNTTAKITYQHGLIYGKLLEREGFEVAQAYLEANQTAFLEYARLCREIDCCYEKKDNYIYSTDNRETLEAEISALDRLGFRASFEKDLPIPVETVGAVRFPAQAQFHPLQFLAHIAKGLNVRENTFVKKIEDGGVYTDKGSVKAKRVVVATHFPIINKRGLYFLKLYQHRSYVLALKGAKELPGMYLDENQNGFSFRSFGKYLLLGGGAHKTGEAGGGYDVLLDFASKHYPDATEAACFAAQDCMSLDSMPYIGRYSKGSGELYVASGFNKWGMTGAMLSAMLLSDELTGIDNEYSKYFSPSRSILKPQLLTNVKSAIKNLLAQGSKRCPHLGCTLKWNSAEHTWDCPCHGSRFDESGKILDNPANKPLKNHNSDN